MQAATGADGTIVPRAMRGGTRVAGPATQRTRACANCARDPTHSHAACVVPRRNDVSTRDGTCRSCGSAPSCTNSRRSSATDPSGWRASRPYPPRPCRSTLASQSPRGHWPRSRPSGKKLTAQPWDGNWRCLTLQDGEKEFNLDQCESLVRSACQFFPRLPNGNVSGFCAR